jgi:hypothetical protein
MLLVIIRQLSQLIWLILNVLLNLLTYYLLSIELVLQFLNLLSQLKLVLVIQPFLTRQLPVNLPFTILHIQLGLCLGLIDWLLQIQDLLVILQRFLGKVILRLFKLILQLLNVQIKFFLFVPQPVKLSLLIQSILDVILKLRISQFLNLTQQVLYLVNQLLLVFLYLNLVAIHIWILLQLPTQSPRTLLQILSYFLLTHLQSQITLLIYLVWLLLVCVCWKVLWVHFWVWLNFRIVFPILTVMSWLSKSLPPSSQSFLHPYST